jgi:SAM-dependent methyltransferase
LTSNTAATAETALNRATFNDPAVVTEYAQSTVLMTAERHLFDRYVNAGDDVLDVGVGTGRTTDALRSRARRYVGLDYAENMVQTCRSRFSGSEFVVGDAARLSMFADSSFDTLVFSFNGLDCLHPETQRRQFIHEARRLLRPGGHLILSVHNARGLFIAPIRQGPGWWQLLRTVKYGLMENARRVASIPFNRAFWIGRGYILERTHGGIVTYRATRDHVLAEIEPEGFEIAEVVGANHPLPLPSVATAWWYYAFCRTEGIVEAGD